MLVTGIRKKFLELIRTKQQVRVVHKTNLVCFENNLFCYYNELLNFLRSFLPNICL